MHKFNSSSQRIQQPPGDQLSCCCADSEPTPQAQAEEVSLGPSDDKGHQEEVRRAAAWPMSHAS